MMQMQPAVSDTTAETDSKLTLNAFYAPKFTLYITLQAKRLELAVHNAPNTNAKLMDKMQRPYSCPTCCAVMLELTLYLTLQEEQLEQAVNDIAAETDAATLLDPLQCVLLSSQGHCILPCRRNNWSKR